jgi:DNA-binding CsgD family transcriptional regulator
VTITRPPIRVGRQPRGDMVTRGHSLAEVARTAGTGEQLTQRQLEILALLRAGRANKEIAYELGIGLGTVKQHVVALFRKLNVTNRAAAVSRGGDFAWHARREAPLMDSGDPDATLEFRPVTVLSLAGGNSLGSAVARAVGARDCVMVARPGEGVDVIFGLHRVDERDCLEAVATARAVASLMPAPDDLRAGMSAGMALASIRRHGGWTGESVAGRAIARAREARDTAPPGSMATDFVSRRMMAFVHRLPFDSDGRDGLLVPLAEGDIGRPHGRLPARPLRDRRAELSVLRAAVRRVADGDGSTVWVEGELGMGKTALCRAMRTEAAEVGALWLECTCGDIPLSRPLAGLARRQGRPPARAANQDDALGGLARALGKGAVIMVVNDCHLADDDTAALLRRIIDTTRTAPLLLLATGRPRRHPLLEVRGEVVVLGRMPDDAVRQMVEDEGEGALPAATVSAICRLAAGVPLFAVELARAALDDVGGDDRLPLPIGLVALVLSRVDALGLDRHLLRLVARRGRSAQAALAAGWSGSHREFDEALSRAVGARVLAATPDGIDFAHPLVGDVIRQTMLGAAARGRKDEEAMSA